MRPGPFGVVDIGTTKTACVIARPDAAGALQVVGFGWHRGRGVRQGNVIDPAETEHAIRAAVGQAEDMAGLRLGAVAVNLSCGLPDSRTLNVKWNLGGRVITDADIQKLLGEGRAQGRAEGRDIIHALALGFNVDALEGVDDPRGLHCDHITAHLHLIDAATSAVRNLIATVARCDLDVAELVATPIASALAVLTEDERALGAIVIDMGGGTTSFCEIRHDHAILIGQVPVGGLHVTQDLAQGLSTTLGAAERLKTLNGHTEGCLDDAMELLTVPMMGEEDHHFQKVARSLVVSIIKPRIEETFELVRDRLDSLCASSAQRVVLTGGASQLMGVPHMASQILKRPVRAARPRWLPGLPDDADVPSFSAALGLLVWASGDGRTLPDLAASSGKPAGFINRLITFLRNRR